MMLKTIAAIFFLFLCAALVGMILLQHRKSGGFSGSFGGGGTQMDVSGGSWQRMNQMEKITGVLVAVFLVFALIFVKL
jgi:preprotein translocase subunit SecG